MNSDWKTGKISQLARVKSGFAFKSSQWTNKGIPVVKIGNVKRGRLDMDGCSFVTENDAAQSGFLLAKGDILIGLTGYYVGEVAKIRGFDSLVLNQRVGKFFPTQQCDPEFLFFLISNDEFRQQVKAAAHGSAQANVSPSSIEAFEVSIPPLSEQRAIAATLGALDDKIELNRRMNATLESMAQALFRDWFVDFGPVRRKLDGATDPVAILSGLVTDPEQAAQTAAIFPDSFGDDGLPEGWEERAIYDFAKVVYGAPFKSKQFNSEKRGRPLARIRDLPKHEGGNYTEEVHPREHLIEPGDIVVGMDGEFRAYVWQGKSTLMNQRVCSFVAHNKANRAFVWLGIQPQLFANENSAIGTTVIHLGKGDINRFQLLSTNSDILLKFSKLVEPMIDLIVVNGQENQTLAATRDLLIPKLMPGEIRLKDAG